MVTATQSGVGPADEPGKDEDPSGALEFHVPRPAVRPGDEPDFSHVSIPPAGSVEKPPIDVAAQDIRPWAHTIMRVLNRSGEAVGPWAGTLSDEAALQGLTAMVRTRAYDARMQMAQRQGKTSFYVQCTGEEAIACAQQMALAPGDMNFPTYRQQGLLLTAGYSVLEMMCQVYSNSGDILRGRQLPVMYSVRDAGFFTISGNLGTQYVQAVGYAMASAIKGDTAIASAWIGDGATASNDFHSALVYASVYRAPVVLNVVNNQWAISSFQGIASGNAATFASRAHGYGIPSLRVDGNDFLAVHAASSWAIERARRNLGPTLIEWVTYRVAAHSTSDDPSKYRPREESDAWPLGDPVIRLKNYLLQRGCWSEEQHQQLEADATAEMLETSREAEKFGTLGEGPKPPARQMFEGVYRDMPSHLQRQLEQIRKGH